MKTAIVINGEIKLVSEHTMLKMNIIVPAKNIQNMIEATNCRLLSKYEIEVTYNHHAGRLYMCKIFVSYEKIRPHLNRKPLVVSESGAWSNSYYKVSEDSWKAYRSLFVGDMYYHDNHLPGDSVGLYTFGDCSNRGVRMITSYYTDANGRTIQLNNTERTDFGRKRYVKNNKKWYSNKKY